MVSAIISIPFVSLLAVDNVAVNKESLRFLEVQLKCHIL